MKSINIIIITVVCLCLSYSATAQSDNLLGTWIGEDGSHILIEKCGTKYCGKTIFVKDKKDEKSLNKYAFINMRYEKDKLYSDGVFIDPSNDKEYKGKITMQDIDNLEIRISAMLGIGYSEKWKRKK